MSVNNVIDATYEFAGLISPDLPFNHETLSTLNIQLDRPQCWVCWYLNQGGNKQPVWELGRNGFRSLRYKDKKEFLTFEQAVRRFSKSQNTRHPAMGIGLVLRPECGIAGVDGDAVFDLLSFDGKLKDYFQKLAHKFNTYTEISVGGDGLHAIGLVSGNRELNSSKSLGGGHNEIRIINNGFITMSGNVLNGYSRAVDITDVTYRLHKKLTGGRKRSVYSGEHIEYRPDSLKLAAGLAKQIDEVNAESNKSIKGDYSGQIFDKYFGPTEKGQRSEQSMRLANLLAFSCGRHMATMVKLYERSAFNKATDYVSKSGGNAMMHDLQKAAQDRENTFKWGVNDAEVEFADIINKYNGSDRALEEVNFSEVEVEAIDWLWEHNFALGCLSIIAGEPGVSKSTLTTFFAAAVSNKAPFPDGTFAPQGDVCIFSAEDHLSKTLAPRLQLAGVDKRKVYSLNPKEGQSLNLHDDIENIERHIGRNRPDTKLLIIDPINAYINGDNVDTHRDTDVRKILNPLGKMAERLNIAVIAVSHFSKSGSNNTTAINKVLGSIAYVGAPRAVFGVVRDKRPNPETGEINPNSRLFLPIKNNLGPCGSGYAYEVKIADVPPAKDVVHAVWTQEEITESIDSIINPPRDRRTTPTKVEEAEDWILNNFTTEWQESGVLEVGAHDAGIAQRTYRRARSELQNSNLVEQKKEASGNVLWRLAEEDPLEA